jgi:hypothetical protein
VSLNGSGSGRKHGENVARVALKHLYNRWKRNPGTRTALLNGVSMAPLKGGATATVVGRADGGPSIVLVTVPRVTYLTRAATSSERLEAIAHVVFNNMKIVSEADIDAGLDTLIAAEGRIRANGNGAGAGHSAHPRDHGIAAD